MKRGDIVRASGGGYAAKPRPQLIVQSDEFLEAGGSVTMCPITSTLTGMDIFRISLSPGPETGLNTASEIEIDKITTVREAAIDDVIGRCPPTTMTIVDAALRRWLALSR